jgi:hypothetical protein
VSPYLGGFEGFDLTNHRGRFGGERFHLSCLKLGLGDAILSHTILVPDLLSCRRILHPGAERERAHQLGVSNKRGAPSIEGGFVLAKEKRFWEFQALGFSLQVAIAPLLDVFRGILMVD